MKAFYLPILFSCLATLAGCQPSPRESELAGSAQGTTYHIKVVLDGLAIDPAPLRGRIEEAFARIDAKLSNYREDSEISWINQQKTTDWLSVSPEIAELVQIARQVHKLSQGCYDLTVKPLFDLWGFSKHENRVPTPAEIDQALAHVGMHRLEVDVPNSRLRKLDPELRIDLSSIAQGYSVGAVASLLESQGIQNYLVEIGGEMKVKGLKANGDPWRVAVEKPTPSTQEVQKILSLHEQKGTAIMTAGTYRNFFESQGKVYSHILDPRTGRPVTHRLLSVTVLHDDPTWADAWDTALLCLGQPEAARLAEAEHLKVLLISAGENHILQEYLSPEFTRAERLPTATEPPPPAPR